MKIIALPEVQLYLESLKKILFDNEYFGFEETAQKYVDDLFLEIKTNLPIYLHKPAPKFFDKYGKGMKYAVFRKSKRTHWYVFFKTYKEDGETIYLIRYIANNHVIAQFL
jgi:hypothetical protein